jgi:hypothetical protein
MLLGVCDVAGGKPADPVSPARCLWSSSESMQQQSQFFSLKCNQCAAVAARFRRRQEEGWGQQLLMAAVHDPTRTACFNFIT